MATTVVWMLSGQLAWAQPEPEPPPAYPAPPVGQPPPTAPGYQPQPYPYPYPPPPRVPTRESRPSAIYGELLGKGLFYSVGYDYAIRRWIAVGGSFSYQSEAVFVSLYSNFYPVGGLRSSLLLQAGIQIVHISTQNEEPYEDLLWGGVEGTDVGGQVTIAYEYRSGFLFRVGLMGMFNRNGLLPWPGITLGGSF